MQLPSLREPPSVAAGRDNARWCDLDEAFTQRTPPSANKAQPAGAKADESVSKNSVGRPERRRLTIAEWASATPGFCHNNPHLAPLELEEHTKEAYKAATARARPKLGDDEFTDMLKGFQRCQCVETCIKDQYGNIVREGGAKPCHRMTDAQMHLPYCCLLQRVS